jgi:hypothetical protein
MLRVLIADDHPVVRRRRGGDLTKESAPEDG